jgi:hypothetical protein
MAILAPLEGMQIARRSKGHATTALATHPCRDHFALQISEYLEFASIHAINSPR